MRRNACGTDAVDAALTLRVRVRNTGGRAGREVAQLYLAFPGGYGEPPLVLGGFRTTKLLLPGEADEVIFGLTSQQLSVYRDAREGWVPALGTFSAFVGASSRNHSLGHDFMSVRLTR